MTNLEKIAARSGTDRPNHLRRRTRHDRSRYRNLDRFHPRTRPAHEEQARQRAGRGTAGDQSGKGNVYYHPYTDEGPYASEKAVGDAGLPEKGVMKFLFDYGDCWRFELRLEKIDPPLSNNTRIVVLEALGQAPEQYPQGERM